MEEKKIFKSQSNSLWLNTKLNESKKINNENSFREDLYVFLNSTICHCYRHLAQVDRSNIER